MKLHTTIDFFDELIPMVWDRERLRQYMKMNAEMGVERIDWIFHGDSSDGFWNNTGLPWSENFTKTFETIGDPYLKTAVEEAHNAGMEIFAVYKPFDLKFQFYPLREMLYDCKTPATGAFNFVMENKESLMQRRNVEKIPAAQIILKSMDNLEPDHQFRLWQSNDNWTYQPVGETTCPMEDGFSVAFDISGQSSKYFAIESMSTNKVANQLNAIIDVKSKDGKNVQYALGLIPRKYHSMDQKYHLKHEFDIGGGFSQEGFYFDFYPGIPSAVIKCSDNVFALSDNEQNVIGVSLEINEYASGALEPAEPRAVEYWLKMIKKTLDCGVDGVNIRITNHNSIINWEEYGFNQPVVDEYIKRYGINPRTSPFDKEKLQRLRGEFYTVFLEMAAALVKGADRKFCLHVADMAFDSPTRPAMMGIHWDWQDWLKKGIPDEVTFKTIYHDSVFSKEGHELINSCHSKNIPVSICPFLHSIPDLNDYLAKIEELGLDAFIAYEAATLWMAEQEGFKEISPAINKILRNKFQN